VSYWERAVLRGSTPLKVVRFKEFGRYKLRRAGSQPSTKESPEWFSGTVRVDPPDCSRFMVADHPDIEKHKRVVSTDSQACTFRLARHPPTVLASGTSFPARSPDCKAPWTRNKLRTDPRFVQHNLLSGLAGNGRSFIVFVLTLLSVFNRIFQGSGASCLVFGTLRFGFWNLPLRFLGVNVCG
jgi:hypothetical protein